MASESFQQILSQLVHLVMAEPYRTVGGGEDNGLIPFLMQSVYFFSAEAEIHAKHGSFHGCPDVQQGL